MNTYVDMEGMERKKNIMGEHKSEIQVIGEKYTQSHILRLNEEKV